MTECVFCEIVKTKEAQGFLETDSTVTFIPLNPVVPGHRLFVPKIHSENVADAWAPGDSVGAFIMACNWGTLKGEDFNIITSAGKNATQTVFHTHIHYVPRRENDGLSLPWTEQKRIGDSAWR